MSKSSTTIKNKYITHDNKTCPAISAAPILSPRAKAKSYTQIKIFLAS